MAVGYSRFRESSEKLRKELAKIELTSRETLSLKRRLRLVRRAERLRWRLQLAEEFESFDWAEGEASFIAWLCPLMDQPGAYKRWRSSYVPAQTVLRALRACQTGELPPVAPAGERARRGGRAEPWRAPADHERVGVASLRESAVVDEEVGRHPRRPPSPPSDRDRILDLTWSAVLKEAEVRTIHMAISGDTVAWWSQHPARPAVLHFVDLATGVELHREPCFPSKLSPTGRGFIGLDTGWKSAGCEPARPEMLVAYTRFGDRIVVERRPVPSQTRLIGVHPREDWILLDSPRGPELQSWSDQRLLARPRPQLGEPQVDWDGGYLWGHTENGQLRLDALDGSWSDVIKFPTWGIVRTVGCGVLRFGYHGLRLYRPRRSQLEPLTLLPPTARWLRDVEVADDGRTVRTVLAHKPRTFEIDLDACKVLRTPGDAAHLARAPVPTWADIAWHPTRDLVALVRRWPRCGVYSGTGRFLFWLAPYSRPRAWLASADAVLAIREGHSGAPRLELWAIPGGTPAAPAHS
jgi:hypothetical protein